MIVGHESVREALELELPPVTLLLGPRSIGKTTLALHVAGRHSKFVVRHERLTAGTARQVVDGAPARHKGLSIYVIDLDNSTEAGQNILLKVLEEPPAHCRFILVASRAPLATVASRARIWHMGLLSDSQVAEVLKQCSITGVEALVAAAKARGQAGVAIELASDRDAARISSVVSAAVRAASEGSGTAVDLALRNWGPEHTKVLERWATEKANGRWVYFSPEFAPKATRRGALAMLYVLSTYDARTAPAVALDVLGEPK